MQVTYYPREFPQKAKDAFETARLKAKKAFNQAKRTLRGSNLERELYEFISKSFFAFAKEGCRLVRERKWTLDQTRERADEFLRRLIISEYYDNLHSGTGGPLLGKFDFLQRDFTAQIKNSDEWQAYEDELITSSGAGPEGPELKSTTSRRGYRGEVKQWMQRDGIETIEKAAHQLGVSTTTLKSIMYPRMKIRHSGETEDMVLRKIGFTGP
jgi:hypothetical protein